MKMILSGMIVLCVLFAVSSAFAENTLSGLLNLGNFITVDKAAGVTSDPIKNIGISGNERISYDARNGLFYTVWLNNTTPHQIDLSKIGMAVSVKWVY
jgi:hypothetical protein